MNCGAVGPEPLHPHVCGPHVALDYFDVLLRNVSPLAICNPGRGGELLLIYLALVLFGLTICETWKAQETSAVLLTYKLTKTAHSPDCLKTRRRFGLVDHCQRRGEAAIRL